MPGHIFGQIAPTATQEQFEAKYNDFFQDYFSRKREKIDDFLLHFLNFYFDYNVNQCFLKFKETIVKFTDTEGLPFLFSSETNEQLMGQKEPQQLFKELLSDNSLLNIFDSEELKNLIKNKILPIIGTRLNLIQDQLKREFLDFAIALSKNKQLSDNSLIIRYKKYFNNCFVVLKNYLKTNLANDLPSSLATFIDSAKLCFVMRNLLLNNLTIRFENVVDNYLENFDPKVVNQNIANDILQVMEETNKLIKEYCELNSDLINEKIKIFEDNLELLSKSLTFADDEECIR